MVEGIVARIDKNLIILEGDDEGGGTQYRLPDNTKFVRGKNEGSQQIIQRTEIQVGRKVALHGPPKGELHAVRLLPEEEQPKPADKEKRERARKGIPPEFLDRPPPAFEGPGPAPAAHQAGRTTIKKTP